MFSWIILTIVITFFLIALFRTIVFKVPDVYIGLPSDFFRGRIKRKKEEGYEMGDRSKKSGIYYSMPIKSPYSEGVNFKPPWWSVKILSRNTETRTIEPREFPVGKGGTVIVSGVIQYRISSRSAYRYEEVNKTAIEKGLDSEIEQIIRGTLVDEDVDSAIKKTFEISDSLERLWKSTDIRTREEKERSDELKVKKTEKGLTAEEDLELSQICNPRSRDLFGTPVTYAEQSYGIEVLKAKIERVDPIKELKDARDAKQTETYQKESQSTEFAHLLEKVTLLKATLPKISDAEAWEAIQVWQRQTTKDIKTIKVEGTDSLTGILAGLFAGGKKDDKKE
ncbi:MAG TPA: hypothetical protein DDY52_05265 [Candidatus Moranbacteria bacterium]|nr:MAG: hypothetical protein UR51_C0023G0008 [Candidatus Moranbacteria bacterium GW2011_GWF1_34_10]HBI17521.1 hypothetical protein [Candidatus Moranbacteria bacterium]